GVCATLSPGDGDTIGTARLAPSDRRPTTGRFGARLGRGGERGGGLGHGHQPPQTPPGGRGPGGGGAAPGRPGGGGLRRRGAELGVRAARAGGPRWVGWVAVGLGGALALWSVVQIARWP